MTVINPNSISGITSITLPAGADNVLTIHSNDGTERFRIDSSGNIKVGTACTISPDGDVFFTGVTTATTFTGAHSGSGANLTSLPAAQVTGTLPAISGANLTNLTAGNLTGALPAISGANLTGIAATDNVRTGILDVAGIATFRSDVNIPNINGGKIGGRRNIIINGAMMVAQRGTSSTGDGYGTVDRIEKDEGGTDESVTQSQVDVASGTTPYTEGFRKAFKLTNGNQTSGAGATDYTRMTYKLEAQDLAKCGWNYTSSSSFVTLSFWIKSSVAQNFYFIFNSADGTARSYVMETGSLSADTWTKIEKTFPGDSNLAFNNDTGVGSYLYIYAYLGTTYTDNSVSVNAWKNVSNPQTPANTTTWWTTNDATLEMTGLQLEVGPQATAFEHRSFGEEFSLCERYFQNFSGTTYAVDHGVNSFSIFPFHTEMRANPTVTGTFLNGAANYTSSKRGFYYHNGNSSNAQNVTFDAEI